MAGWRRHVYWQHVTRHAMLGPAIDPDAAVGAPPVPHFSVYDEQLLMTSPRISGRDLDRASKQCVKVGHAHFEVCL